MSDELIIEIIEEEKLPTWVNEFYKAIGYAMFLAYHENDTSLRISYILLDNAVEQFLKSNLKSQNIKIKEYSSFPEIISEIKKLHDDLNNVLDRISECHDTRNILYHKSVYVSVSKDRFKEYLDEVLSMCNGLGYSDSKDIAQKEFNNIFKNVYRINFEQRYHVKQVIENQIKDNFGIPPGHYQRDFVLASPIGITHTAVENFELILAGILTRNGIDGVKARVLELIEANEENAFHSFFVNHVESSTWFCFIDCMWSKWGEGERRDIKNIRDLINRNKPKVLYKIDYVRRGFIKQAFDPYYTGDISFRFS